MPAADSTTPDPAATTPAPRPRHRRPKYCMTASTSIGKAAPPASSPGSNNYCAPSCGIRCRSRGIPPACRERYAGQDGLGLLREMGGVGVPPGHESPAKPPVVGANRQRIVYSKSPGNRQRIVYLKGRENRHNRRVNCRSCTPRPRPAGRLGGSRLPWPLSVPLPKWPEIPGLPSLSLCVASRRGDRRIGPRTGPVSLAMLSNPTPIYTMRCRFPTPETTRCAVGKK